MERLRVFIGTESAQWLPTAVLKYTITSRTSLPLEFHELKNIPLNLKLKMYTGFSFYRFSIPEACQFAGKAIYLDADIVVLCNIQELYDHNMQGHGVLARKNKEGGYYTSVMLMDCSKLKSWKIQDWVTMINAGINSYQGTMGGLSSGLGYKDYGPLDPCWNGLDEWDEQTKILHYTYVPSQPWKVPGHPLAYIFLREMKGALEKGVITKQDVEREISLGHIYQGILEDATQVERH